MSEKSTAAQQSLREFFDLQPAPYEDLKKLTVDFDRFIARQLNDEVRGRALTVGGVWAYFEWRSHLESLNVLDLSEPMLQAYCPKGAQGVVGDLYSVAFEPQSFDAVVLPLILHHTPLGGWRMCQRRVEEAVDRASRWLKPEGRLFIVEWCPHPVWYGLERLMLPITRRFLRIFGQPLVVMYARRFYEHVLSARFRSVEARKVAPDGFNWWGWYPVFMSTPWLKLPFAIYPKMYVFVATAPRSS
jgi:SAM-dependent methyltransferase